MSLLRDHSNISFTIWVALTLTLGILFRSFPGLAEALYGNFVYPIIRVLYDYTFGFFPWPSVYVLLPLWLLFLFGFFQHGKRGHSKLLAFLKRAILILCAFYWLWAFNYMRPDLKTKLGIAIPEVNPEQLICFFEHHCEASNQILTLFESQKNESPDEEKLRNEVSNWFTAKGLPTYGKPRLRKLKPEGILLGISTAGIYFPYSVEPHIDAGLHPITQPVTGAHEMGHAYGITDEGECNYIGAAVCLESENLSMKYSAHVQIIRWTFYPLLRLGYRAEDLRELIGPAVLAEIKAIQDHHDSFPEYFPYEWRNLIYNSYLKAQGVESGLESYGEVVGMLMADYLAADSK